MLNKNWQIILILIIGVIAVSTAAIFIRLLQQTANLNTLGFSVFMAASRLIISSIIILPAWGNLRQDKCPQSAYYYAIGAGFCLAMHFACWISSLSYTSIAISTTLVTTNPLWVTIISWLWFKEKISKLTFFGIMIALIGGIFIANQDININSINSSPFMGNILALIAAIMASFYLILGRQAQHHGLSIKSYIVVAYTTGAVILFPLPFLFNTSYLSYSNLVYFYLLLMAIIPQLIGHTSFNWAIKFTSPTLVSLAILFEPIGASFLAWLLFGEEIAQGVLIGAIILLLGVAIAIIGTKKYKI
jgi:drug/metabolite transporter (DMT)-like permease